LGFGGRRLGIDFQGQCSNGHKVNVAVAEDKISPVKTEEEELERGNPGQKERRECSQEDRSGEAPWDNKEGVKHRKESHHPWEAPLKLPDKDIAIPI